MFVKIDLSNNVLYLTFNIPIRCCKGYNTLEGKCWILSSKTVVGSDETRKSLIEAFCLLYREKPLAKITVQAVTRKAGYNRTTFYQYFLDIDDILRQVENSLLDYIVQKRYSLETDKQTHSFIEDLVDLYQKRAVEVNALLGPYGRGHFTEILKQGLDLKFFNLDTDTNNKYQPYLIEFRLTSALNLFALWLSRGQDISVEELIELVTKLYHYNSGLKELADSRNNVGHE